MSKQARIPGQHHRRSIVTSSVADEDGGGLRGHERTIIDTNNFDGRWSGRIEGVTWDGQALRLRLSHEQLIKIFDHMTAIKGSMRSDRATNAAGTRRLRQRQYDSLTAEAQARVDAMAAEIEGEMSLTASQARQRAMAILKDEMSDRLGSSFAIALGSANEQVKGQRGS